MSSNQLFPPQHALILAAGDLIITPRVRALAGETSLVVAADGGARHAVTLGLTLTQWVGDFDSSDGIILDAPRQTFPTEKDSTDLELAVLAAKNLGATSATILGAFGGRFDHALGIALLAARETKNGFVMGLESGSEAAWIIVNQQFPFSIINRTSGRILNNLLFKTLVKSILVAPDLQAKTLDDKSQNTDRKE